MKPHSKTNKYRMGILAAIITGIGTLFSGPLAFLAVSLVQPQPAWSGSQVYVENYHPIQSVTFYFGFLLVCGSVMLIAWIYNQQKELNSVLALVFAAIAGGLIAFNYFTQATYVPALVRNFHPSLDPILQMYAVTNPSSLFWSIEMWGYGFLGLGTLLVVDYFDTKGVEGWTRGLFFTNGVVSMVGALYTSFHLEWVLSVAGLISYALWNVLYLVLAILFLIVVIRRQRSEKGRSEAVPDF